jgi:hypothetical protein
MQAAGRMQAKKAGMQTTMWVGGWADICVLAVIATSKHAWLSVANGVTLT